MSVYTRNGDRGITDLTRFRNVSKADDRIGLVGTVDELISHLGLIKALMKEDQDTVRILDKIQETLVRLMEGTADPYNKEYRIAPDRTEHLEQEIDRMEALFSMPAEQVLPGGSRLSAELDIARTVCRRAERALASVTVKFGSDQGSRQYLNRLADYLFILARFTDARDGENKMTPVPSAAGSRNANAAAANTTSADADTADKVAAEVLKRIGLPEKLTLPRAKALIEGIEAEAKRRGTAAVIAVCSAQGNPIAVHVMDGAFLVSFDVAMKKAYTSAAVRMSTMELGKMAQPGGTFYGVDKLDGGRIVIFGGGVPLVRNGIVIGGLGVSGGTGEEDHQLAEYGLSLLPEIFGN